MPFDDRHLTFDDLPQYLQDNVNHMDKLIDDQKERIKFLEKKLSKISDLLNVKNEEDFILVESEKVQQLNNEIACFGKRSDAMQLLHKSEIIKLQREVNDLRDKLGQRKKYDVPPENVTSPNDIWGADAQDRIKLFRKIKAKFKEPPYLENDPYYEREPLNKLGGTSQHSFAWVWFDDYKMLNNNTTWQELKNTYNELDNYYKNKEGGEK